MFRPGRRFVSRRGRSGVTHVPGPDPRNRLTDFRGTPTRRRESSRCMAPTLEGRALPACSDCGAKSLVAPRFARRAREYGGRYGA